MFFARKAPPHHLVVEATCVNVDLSKSGLKLILATDSVKHIPSRIPLKHEQRDKEAAFGLQENSSELEGSGKQS